jgi:hypothetical protein
LVNDINNSHIAKDQFSLFFAWDQGSIPLDKSPISTAIAWEGAGWSALRCRHEMRHISDKCSSDTLGEAIEQAYKKMLPDINNRAAEVVQMHDLAKGGQNNPDDNAWMSPQARVAHRLARYLPKHKKQGYYGMDFQTGLLPYYGPAAWLPYQGWRHAMFDDLERDLIFENWLVPFSQPNGDWSLQPGSLLLLYWAGYVLGVWEPMLSPLEFIEQHDWHGWFGGRLK